MFSDSSVVPSFLVRRVENENFPCMHNLDERTRQVWRENSRRVRTYEKNSRCCLPIGQNNVKPFLCPIRSQHSTVWKWYGESRYPRALPLIDVRETGLLEEEREDVFAIPKIT